jgi:hypothetical protein
VLAAIEELLGAVFSLESTQKLYQRELADGQTSPEDFRSCQSVKYGHTSPMGLKTKNHFAGKGQQKFNSQTSPSLKLL